MGKTYIAVIPAYEPDAGLPDLVSRVREAGLLPVVADDGSGPDYRAVFDAVRPLADVISYEPNRGKGYALKAAFRYIKEKYRENYVIVTMDSDGQHRVEDALRLCVKAEEQPEALILGSRKQSRKSPLKSRFGNGATRLVFRLLTGVYVYDTQTGLRAFSEELTDRMLSVSGDRYEYEMNVLLKCAQEKIPMQEVPVETIYIDNNAGSHFRVFADSFRVYGEILRYLLSSAAATVTDYVLYVLLSLLTASLPHSLTLSNVGARIVSSCVNFSVNRKYVFRSRKSLIGTAVPYFLLAAFVLLANTLLLHLLTAGAGMDRYLAKFIANTLLSLLSWGMQKFLIFRKKEE